MDAIIVVDMQAGLLDGAPKYALGAVVERINRLADMIRGDGGAVIWIRHCGRPGDDCEPHQPGWSFLPELNRQAGDLVVEKSLNDAFAGTDLQAILDGLAPDRVLVAGWATDFCVDATVRSAVSHDHHVVVVADGHTLSDRPHLDAPSVIRHHNWVWSNLLTNASIRVADAGELLAGRKGS